LLDSLPALLQEPPQLATEDQNGSSIVDGRQVLLQPAADGVLMDAEQPCDFLRNNSGESLRAGGWDVASPSAHAGSISEVDRCGGPMRASAHRSNSLGS